MKSFLRHHYLILIFVALYIAFSLVTYKQYGITSDEQLEYNSGKLLLNYFSKPSSPTETLQTTLVMDEKAQLLSSPLFSPYSRIYPALLNALNPTEYYEWFHLLNLLFALPLFVAVYFVVYSHAKNQWPALLGPVFLALIPSFFGHIPANPKDIPFASFYYLSVVALYYFSKKESSYTSILVLGFLFGMTQSLRVIGFSIYFVYLIQYLFFARQPLGKNFVLSSLLTFITALFVMVMQWPFIGMNFFQNLKSVLLNSGFFYLWDKKVLFMGEFVSRDARPWYYLPVWFLVTTPIFLLILAVIPLFIKSFYKNKFVMLLYVTLAVNFLIYLIIKPVIYNGLRHFLFFIPLVVTIAAVAFLELYKKTRLAGIFLVGIVPVVFNIAALFPYHYVYFNELAGGTAKAYTQFDLDYWGASYKTATEWFRENLSDVSPKAKVYACNNGFAVDYVSYKKFEITTNRETADYIFCDVTSDMYRGYSGEIVRTFYKNATPLIYIRKNVKPL